MSAYRLVYGFSEKSLLYLIIQKNIIFSHIAKKGGKSQYEEI